MKRDDLSYMQLLVQGHRNNLAEFSVLRNSITALVLYIAYNEVSMKQLSVLQQTSPS